MRYTIVSDIHGKTEFLEKARTLCPETPLVQVGDFGMGFNSLEWEIEADQWNIANNARFIRGNHDDPAACKASLSWIEDGHIENDVMFIGGAASVDQYLRTAGYDWWPEEELSDDAFEALVEKYREAEPRFMVTHDAPHEVNQRMFYDLSNIRRTRTSYWFDVMMHHHQPEAWVFGHWHLQRALFHRGTVFRCLSIGESIILDTEHDYAAEMENTK